MIKIKRLILCLTTTLIFSGCVYTPVSLPKLPEPKACPEVKPVTCPKLDMPEAIPKNMAIEIKDGAVVKIDAGGEKLIRSYAATRKTIKSLWHD